MFPIFDLQISAKHLFHRMMIVLMCFVPVLSGCGKAGSDAVILSDDELIAKMASRIPRIKGPWQQMVFPTDQQHLLETNYPGAYQPTASGRLGSALYGSVRTANRGGRLMSSFHEGIDIAALKRDRRQRPLDEIYAVADGRVAYVNKVAGNSNYGRYVVLIHDDPVGEVYTLYAHLASVKTNIKRGTRVESGQTLGVMGHSASSGIPVVRAHLHFEVGLVLNERYKHWYKKNNKRADHGNYHGWNLIGVNPLVFLQHQHQDPEFSMAKFMYSVPRAFDLIIKKSKQLNYFKRYPLLWKDGTYEGPHMLLECSENGLPLSGRTATDEEVALAGKLPAVLHVDGKVLGRNGRHLITKRKNKWSLTRTGKKHLDMLRY